MNPPFSDKDWSDGIKPVKINSVGLMAMVSPEKNGDYAWFCMY